MIIKNQEESAVLSLLEKQISGRPERFAILMDLALKWHRIDLEEILKN